MAEKSTTTKDFAVIATGGKQYIVCVGDVLDVELIGEHQDGDKIEFDQVLMTDNGTDTKLGTPFLKGAKVKASFMADKKGKKLSIVRYKAKSNRFRKIGHRQQYATVKIEALA